MDKIERNLIAEERIKQVNRDYNPNPTTYQTSAPVVGETNAQKLYMTVQDLENLKKSVMDFSKDYSNEFANLVSHFEKITDNYESLIKKIDDLKTYIQNISTTFNKNAGKINGEIVEDIRIYTDKDSEDSYYKTTILPKLESIYENSIANATNIIESNIVQIISYLNENSTWQEILTEDFLNSINYYEHFDSVVDTENAFKIEKVNTVSGEISDNGTLQISKVDPSKYNRIKAITKGNDIVEVTVVSTNQNGGGAIVQTTCALENFNRSASENNPIFPELFKTSAEKMKNGFISEMKANYDIDEVELEDEIEEIYSNMKVLATLSYNGEEKDEEIFVKGKCSIVNFGDGSVFVNGSKADFKVESLHGYYNSIIACTLSGELYAIGDNTNNRLGLGRNNTIIREWTKLNIDEDSEIYSVFVSEKFSIILTNKGTYIAGDSCICSANEAYNFVKITLSDGSIPIFKKMLGSRKYDIAVFEKDDGKLYICGNNDLGQCGIENVDEVVHPVILSVADDINFISFTDNTTYILDKNKKLWASGNNDCGQIGQRFDLFADYVKEFKLVKENVSFCATQNRGCVILTKDKEVFACGNNISGRFGINSNKEYNEMTLIRNVDPENLISLKNKVDYIYLGDEKLFIVANGKLWVSGKNTYGDLGTGNTNSVKKLTAVNTEEFGTILHADLYKNLSAICCEKDDKIQWYLCGDNRSGHVGSEDNIVTKFIPTGVILNENSNAQGIELVVNKDDAYCILDNGGENVEVYASGRNMYGELGFGNRTKTTSFAKLSIESPYVTDGVYEAKCGLTPLLDNERHLWIAGLNSFAQSGSTEKEAYITEFRKVSNDIECKEVKIFGNTIFIITEDDDLYTFGDNILGTTGVEGISTNIVSNPEKSGFSIDEKRNVAEIDDNLIVLENEIELSEESPSEEA